MGQVGFGKKRMRQKNFEAWSHKNRDSIRLETSLEAGIVRVTIQETKDGLYELDRRD